MKFYQVKVTFENEPDEKGKIKKTSEQYLVDAISPTEAETRTTKWLKDQQESRDFEVKSASESRIIQVIK